MMKNVLICSIFALFYAGPATVRAEDKTLDELLSLERGVMDGWLEGNPDKLLASLDPAVTYINAATNARLEGVSAVKALCEPYRGRPLYDGYEITQPLLHLAGDAAVLTYQLTTRNGTTTSRWNATQVYKRTPGGWRVIHTHWSRI